MVRQLLLAGTGGVWDHRLPSRGDAILIIALVVIASGLIGLGLGWVFWL